MRIVYWKAVCVIISLYLHWSMELLELFKTEGEGKEHHLGTNGIILVSPGCHH